LKEDEKDRVLPNKSFVSLRATRGNLIKKMTSLYKILGLVAKKEKKFSVQKYFYLMRLPRCARNDIHKMLPNY